MVGRVASFGKITELCQNSEEMRTFYGNRSHVKLGALKRGQEHVQKNMLS